MTQSARASLLAGLSTVLWREREVLELLLFKLVEEQMVVTCRQHRWLARAMREVELVVGQVQTAGLGRAVEVSAVTHELGLGEGATLRTIIASVEDPWPDILTKHREAFLGLTREITDVAQCNRAVIERAQAATTTTLRWLAEDAGDQTGPWEAQRRQSAPQAAHTVTAAEGDVADVVDADETSVATELQLQEAVYRAALQTAATIIQPSLVSFLS
jgi:hypothetical protein